MDSRIPSVAGRRVALYCTLALLALGLAYGAFRYWYRPAPASGPASIAVDLTAPDALIASRNLAELPRDIASARLLAGLVDEEFVFYYEEDEARLSLEGTLRRLAFEHQLDLGERFLATLLSAPAEVAWWRSGKGRPEHFVARLERGVLAKLAETLARVALSDSQLQIAARLRVGGENVTLLALGYGGRRTLGLAGLGEHWVVLSDPGLVLDAAGQLSEAGASLLSALLRGQQPWAAQLPANAAARHSVVVGSKALTLDYARFLPALAGMRFDHLDGVWRPSLRLDAQRRPEGFDTATIWQAVPLGAALCAALPVDWTRAGEALQPLAGDAETLKQTLAALDPLGAVCWYPGARLAAPLFVARAARELPAQAGELMAHIAEQAWGGQPSAAQELYAATVASVHGARRPDGGRSFDVALARRGDLLAFSPERALVEAALAVQARRAPALADEAGFKTGRGAWLVADPAALARLLKAEVQGVLPRDEESVLRQVAQERLWPRLDAWGRRQPATVLVPGQSGADGFVPLENRALKGPAS